MNEDIPYGPEQKPWKVTLSPLAVDKDGTLLITPPSQDPAKIYDNPRKERGVTPCYYQVPSLGLSTDDARKAQDQTFQIVDSQTKNILGYQTSYYNNYSIVSRYLGTFLNNIGDPFVPGNYTMNTKWMERNVLDYYASLWNAKWPHDPEDPETYWGYVSTMGSSEGNLYGIWNARDYLQGKCVVTDFTGKGSCVHVQRNSQRDAQTAFTPVAFFSQDSHYSLVKCTMALQIKTFYELGNELYPNDCPLGGAWPNKVPSEGGDTGPGSIDIDKLYKLVEFFAAKGYPPLIILNCGTTFKGAYDDVQAAGERLMPMLKMHGLDERWIEIDDPNQPDKPKLVKRKGYWIHVDGALGAAYMPFLHMAFKQGRTTIKPPPVFDFQLPFVSSMCTSAHKWPGAPWPIGIFMTKIGLRILPPTTPEYTGSPDTTFAGSRNGLSVLIWWTYISEYNYESQVNKIVYCLDLMKYAYEELKKVESDTGMDIWIKFTPLTLSLQFMQPNDDIIYKYTLCTAKFRHGDDLRSYVHLYMMGATKKETINDLMQDLRKPGAFPLQSKKSDNKYLWHLKKNGVEQNVCNKNGIIVCKADENLKDILKSVPVEGRGFL